MRTLNLLILLSFPLLLFANPPSNLLFVQADLLYMTPSYDETYFVIDGTGLDGLGTPTPNGRAGNNPVGYSLGFRLATGIYRICGSCVDFRLRWTHLYSTDKSEVVDTSTPPQLWPTQLIPNLPNVPQPYSGDAISRIGVMHQKGEALLDERLWNLGAWYFNLREGLEWSYIRYHEVVRYNATTVSQRNQFHGHSKGMGPQLGVLAFWEPWQNFCWYPEDLYFKFQTTASLIVANTKAKVTMTDITQTQNRVTASSFWRLLPEWNLGLAINYNRLCFNCFQANFELGYEATVYFRGISKIVFDDATSPGHSFNQFSDFYVHGLFFSCTFIF